MPTLFLHPAAVLRRTFAFLAFCLSLVACLAAESGRRSFDIPAEAAEKSLLRFAAQSGQEVLFSTEAVAGVRTNAVKGMLTPLEAATQMLAGTRLRVVEDSKNGILRINRAPDPNAGRAAQPSDRPATSDEIRLAAAMAAATRSASTDPNETLVLSPFEVRPEEDSGYLATSALSGTRLRSELKFIPAAVSVVTKDFMRDVNAKDLTTLLVYTLGTEVAGPGGNFSGTTIQPSFVDFETPLGNASPNTRVRGLISADTARDFFITNVPLDGFNVDRVEINRGANSLLFGLGSPGGIANYALIRAEPRKTKSTVEHQLSSNRSHRGVLDHNHVLLRDTLALRLATVYDETNYRAKPAFERRKAAYITSTYRPFRNTTLRLSTEAGESDSNKPWGRTPFDGISTWWALGKPVYNPATDELAFLGTPQAPFTTATPFTNVAGNVRNTNVITAIGMGASSNTMSLVFSDPNSAELGIPGQPFAAVKGFADRAALNPNGTFRSSGLLGLAGAERFLNNVVYANSITRGFWRIPMISDPRLFDFYHHMPDGGAKHEWANWNTYNATLEQSLLDGRAGFEGSYNRENLDNMSVVPFTYVDLQLRLDINTHLPNGEPNPNFGRVMMGSPGFVYRYATDLEVGRVTGYYKLDLRRTGPSWLGALLGRHLFTGTHSSQKKKSEIRQAFPFNTGPDYSIANAGNIRGVHDSLRVISVFHYMNSDVSQTNSVRDVSVQPIRVPQWPLDLRSVTMLTNVPAPTNATTPNPWTTQTYSINSIGPNDNVDATLIGPWVDLKGEEVKSSVLTAQSYWWNDLLVTTGGWRKDTVDTFVEGTARVDPGTGVGDINYNRRFVSSIEEDSWSGGAVLQAPTAITRRLPWKSTFSLAYSRSTNFRVTSQRYNVFGEAIGPETGRTEEYGIRLSALEGKVDFRINRYKTSANDSSSAVNLSTQISQLVTKVRSVEATNRFGFNDDRAAGLAGWETWKNTPGAQQFFRTFRFDFAPEVPTANARTLEVLPTSDTVATGLEFELIANPTRNWRVSLNAARTKAVRAHTGEDLRALIDSVFAPMLASEAGSLRIGAQQGSLRDDLEIVVLNPMNAVVLQDGSPTPELRRWRLNAVSSFDLPWAFTKGWTITGAYRWQDRAAIGYPVTTTPAGIPIPDVRHPYYGAQEHYFDAALTYRRKLMRDRVGWRVSLHLRNIGVGNELRAVHAQPDGSIDAWQIKEPMRWTLSNTFDF